MIYFFLLEKPKLIIFAALESRLFVFFPWDGPDSDALPEIALAGNVSVESGPGSVADRLRSPGVKMAISLAPLSLSPSHAARSLSLTLSLIPWVALEAALPGSATSAPDIAETSSVTAAPKGAVSTASRETFVAHRECESAAGSLELINRLPFEVVVTTVSKSSGETGTGAMIASFTAALLKDFSFSASFSASAGLAAASFARVASARVRFFSAVCAFTHAMG